MKSPSPAKDAEPFKKPVSLKKSETSKPAKMDKLATPAPTTSAISRSKTTGKNLTASKSKSPVKVIAAKGKPASTKEAAGKKAPTRSATVPKIKSKSPQKAKAVPERKRDEKASRKKAE